MTENLTGLKQPGTQMAEDIFLRELSVPGEGLELMTRSRCLENKNITGGSCCCIKSHLTKFSCFTLHVNMGMFSGLCFSSPPPSQCCRLSWSLSSTTSPFCSPSQGKGVVGSNLRTVVWRCCWGGKEVSPLMTQSFTLNNRRTCGEKVNE